MWDRIIDFVPIPNNNYIPCWVSRSRKRATSSPSDLRKDVKWTDGKPFTSKDVLSTYKLYFVNNHVVWRYLDKIEAPDDNTVVFTWRSKPSPVLKPMLFEINVNAPYHIYGKWADKVDPLLAKRDASGNLDEAANKERNVLREDLFTFKPAVTDAVGTGPFKVANVTTSDMLLEKKDNWRAART